MSSGKIIQFKQAEPFNSLVETPENKRRFPQQPVKFFGISESNPVKFFGITEIVDESRPENIEIDSLPENNEPKIPSEKDIQPTFPPKETAKLPQKETAKLPQIKNTLPNSLPGETVQFLQTSDIVEANISNIDIETVRFRQVSEIAEQPMSDIDIDSITISDELPRYDISPSVLIIEDDRVISSFLQHLLKRRGFLTHHAPDGIKAVNILEEIPPPNLVIVDLMLPFLDGFELIKKIRDKDEWENIPIIVVTAKTQEQDITRAFEAGANDYLVKPFRSQELIARVKRLVPQK